MAKCKYCGREFVSKSKGTKPMAYCSIECKKDAETVASRIASKWAQDRQYAREQMRKVDTGKLDKALDECRANGISYAEYQKQRTLERINNKMIDEIILEKNVDDMWYPYGKYKMTANDIRALCTAVSNMSGTFPLRLSTYNGGAYEFYEIGE